MKVALVSEWLDAWRGGAETSTLQMINHMREAGVELDVFTRSRPSPSPGMRIHTVSGAGATRLRASVTFAHRVDRRIRADRFDVVHAISPCLAADIYQPRGGTVAESIERNLAIVRHASLRRLRRVADGLNFKRRYQLAVERRLMRPGRRPVVVAISDYVVRQLKKHYGLTEGRIRRIYNAVELDVTPESQRRQDRADVRRHYRIAEGELLVILVAHNFRLKGVGPWMAALAELVHRRRLPVRSLVIGKAPAGRWLVRARSMGLERHLTFTGPSNRVLAFMHAADVLVHPTFYDPCSRVVLEAMVCGLPCVTTRWDGAGEVIVDGQNGFVIAEPTATTELADRVALLADAGRRRAIGERAAEVAPQVSIERHARQILELYRELAPSAAAQTEPRLAQPRLAETRPSGSAS